jgi:hypothetical protein
VRKHTLDEAPFFEIVDHCTPVCRTLDGGRSENQSNREPTAVAPSGGRVRSGHRTLRNSGAAS